MELVQIANMPRTDPAWYHIIEGDPPLALLVEGSRIFALPRDIAADPARHLSRFRYGTKPRIPTLHYPSALSLNLAQTCNLSCSYCYADEGRFGGKPALMTEEVAFRAIRQLLQHARNARVSIGFIGGEPLLNRSLLHSSVAFAGEEGRKRGLKVTFGITTNGTLVEPEDLELFRSNSFAVTVSLDGPREWNDQSRLSHRKTSTFDETVRRVRPLLKDNGMARVAARATICRQYMDVRQVIEALSAEGFDDIGISPLQAGASSGQCLRNSDWAIFLHHMKSAALQEWDRVRNGGQFRFANLAVALKQVHRGASEALPCGSAARYISLSASGEYYTCHRTIGDSRFRLGDLDSGPSAGLRRSFIESRYVDRQTPCAECWARYLCGGGCHAEVAAAGRHSCDYIRGWLDFVIRLYPSVSAERPDLLHEKI